MPDGSKVMTQTKRDNLGLQVGDWEWGLATTPNEKRFVEKLLKLKTGHRTVLKEAKAHQGL
jgi:hypothetical protein